MQGVQVLAISATAAASANASQAMAERESVYTDFGSLAEDMLAVQDSLQAFSQAGESLQARPSEPMPSEALPPQVRLAGGERVGAAPPKGESMGAGQEGSVRLRPGTAPVLATEWSGSNCSSISFNKGAGPSSTLQLAASSSHQQKPALPGWRSSVQLAGLKGADLSGNAAVSSDRALPRALVGLR